MVWAAAEWAARLFPRLMCDGAGPGWLVGCLNVLSNAERVDSAVVAAAYRTGYIFCSAVSYMYVLNKPKPKGCLHQHITFMFS